jgi:hypothetical protein
MQQRDHQYVSGVYVNRDSPLVVFCPEHNQKLTTPFCNYKRSKTGLKCCGNESKRDKLIGRVFSPETIEKMKSYPKPSRGGQPRRWRENTIYKEWKAAVVKLWGSPTKCVISSETSN